MLVAKSALSILQWLLDSKNQIIILLVLLMGMGVWVYNQRHTISNLEQTTQQLKSNIFAITDTLQTRTTERGVLIAERGALQTDKASLEIINNTLYTQLIKLEQEVSTLQSTGITIQRDTIYDIPTAAEYLGDSNFIINWSDVTRGEWGLRELSGRNTFRIIGDTLLVELQTDIIRDILQMRIQTGYNVLPNGFIKVFASTDYPGVTFTSVDGVIIDPNFYVAHPKQLSPSRWGLGLHVGYGVTQYGISPYIGVGVSYSLFNWRR
jgi:hypothetical protein